MRNFALGLLSKERSYIKGNFVKTAKQKIGYKLATIQSFLGSRKFLMGYLTLADFELAHVIELFQWLCDKTCTENPFTYFPKLVEINYRIKELDGVKQFCSTDKENIPFFPKGYAKFD